MDLLVACQSQMTSAHPLTSVPNWRVPIKQNHAKTKVQQVWNSSSDVCSDEISGRWRSTHRLRQAPSTDSDYPPVTDLPHSHVMLSSHRWQDKSVIHQPLIGLSSEFDRWGTGSTTHQSLARRQSIGDSVGHKFFKTNKLERARLLVGGCHVCNQNVIGMFSMW